MDGVERGCDFSDYKYEAFFAAIAKTYQVLAGTERFNILSSVAVALQRRGANGRSTTRLYRACLERTIRVLTRPSSVRPGCADFLNRAAVLHSNADSCSQALRVGSPPALKNLVMLKHNKSSS